MKIPRVLISSTSSSSGKTTVVCALLQKYMNDFHSGKASLPPSSVKCGPDYIDPLFHKTVIGNKTGNIDLFFTDEQKARKIFASDAKDSSVTVCEAAMGYYDGKGGDTDIASGYATAKALECPVILVINVKGKSLSVCAEINGFTTFREVDGDKSLIKGVILNRCSKKLYEKLKSVIEKECGTECLGYVPDNPDFALPSRHLGLVTPDSVKDIKQKINLMAETVSECVDTHRILEIAQNAPDLHVDEINNKAVNPCYKLGVPFDSAFCFYYRENLELLEKEGAQIVYFSPLKDKELPQGISALYLGGGYPELFINELADNVSMAKSIKAFAKNGAPVYAECGGFLYLLLIGVLNGTFSNTGHLVRFGYTELTCNEDNFLLLSGEKIKAHEFHYFDTTDNGEGFTAKKDENTQWQCIQVSSPVDYMHKSHCDKSSNKNIVAGFPHMYFESNPLIAKNFCIAALQYESLKDLSGCTGCSGSGGCGSCSGCGSCGGDKNCGNCSHCHKEGNND